MTQLTYQIPALKAVGNTRAVAVILAASAGIFAFLIWLLYFKHAAGDTSGFITALPAVNASLNALSAILLSLGLIAILNNRPALHMKLMFSALASSAAFLTFYLIYHNAHGNTLFHWYRAGEADLFSRIDIAHCNVGGRGAVDPDQFFSVSVGPVRTASAGFRDLRSRSGCMCR